MENDGGLLFIDPQGRAIDTILSHVPKRRTRDVLLIDPTDVPVGWNILDQVENKPLTAAILSQTIKSIWNYDGVATPIMDRMTYSSVAALLEYPRATLLDFERFFLDSAFRTSVLDTVSDSVLKRRWDYWTDYPEKEWRQLISSTENKAGEFTEDPRVRAIIGQRSTFNLKRMLFDRKIILLRLPQGELAGKTGMLGSLFLAHLQAVAYSRHIHIPFNVFVDDCYLFDTPVLRQLVGNGARFGLSLSVANQYLAQLSPELRSSLIGNASRRVIFRTGYDDSETLHRVMPPNNNQPKFHELAPFEAILAEGQVSNAFTRLKTEQVPPGPRKRATKVVATSRGFYARAKRGN